MAPPQAVIGLTERHSSGFSGLADSRKGEVRPSVEEKPKPAGEGLQSRPILGASAARLVGRRSSRGRKPPLHANDPRVILNLMVQYARARLDASFAALSDATRRGVLEQLGRSDASITDLAEKFRMTLTGMKKHVGVLEQAGLVTTEKVGRVRTCKLGPRRLEEEAAWIERYRQLWDARFDELDKVVEELKRKEKVDGRKKRE
jgi:DNA-binding transcriptional ArsR family regulator